SYYRALTQLRRLKESPEVAPPVLSPAQGPEPEPETLAVSAAPGECVGKLASFCQTPSSERVPQCQLQYPRIGRRLEFPEGPGIRQGQADIREVDKVEQS